MLLWAAVAAAAPEVVLSEEDAAVEEAGAEPVGQGGGQLLAGIWEKGFLRGRDARVVLGGYVETEYHDEFEGGPAYFDQHRLVLFVYARPHDRVSFATEIEWEHGGTPRKRNGELVGGESLLEFAVVDFRVTEWFQTRAGIVLVPVGAYNIRHDAPTQDLTTRPLVSTFISPSTWFEAGAGFFGRVPLGEQRLDYELYAINGLDTKLYDGLGTRAARGSLGEDNNRNKAAVGRVAWRPLATLELAASGYRGAYDPDGDRPITLAAGDWTARAGPVELQGEAVAAWIAPGFDEGWVQASRNPVPERMWGAYGQVNVHWFIPGLAARLPDELADSTFTSSVRLGRVDTDANAITSGDRVRAIVGLNYRPFEAFALKNEILLDRDGGSGSLPAPWRRPSAGYVGSVALLF